MNSESPTKERTRFDTRLPKEQKLMFEKAANLGGFRSLTEFILFTVNNKAKEIIMENKQIIASKQDAEIFFSAIVNPSNPNKKLKSAMEDYLNITHKK